MDGIFELATQITGVYTTAFKAGYNEGYNKGKLDGIKATQKVVNDTLDGGGK